MESNFFNKKEIKGVVTSKGSVYKYLDDGRTERFKKAENKNYNPQDLLVFVPNYDWVLKNNPKWLFDRHLENRSYYEEYLLENMKDANISTYIVDTEGNKVETNKEASLKDKLFMVFVKNGVTETTIPVSSKPVKGFQTYDTRVFIDDSGNRKREKHLGNDVIEIME